MIETGKQEIVEAAAVSGLARLGTCSVGGGEIN